MCWEAAAGFQTGKEMVLFTFVNKSLAGVWRVKHMGSEWKQGDQLRGWMVIGFEVVAWARKGARGKLLIVTNSVLPLTPPRLFPSFLNQ